LAAALGADRFHREIEIAAQLTHPHILALHDSGEAEGFLYYIMPHVEGESLRQRLNRETQLPIDEALRFTEQVALALDYAHRHDVIHRDIKPENILLHEGEAMVTDFGIALAVKAAGGERLTDTGFSLGTPAYMSPEQVVGDRDVDGRSDIYSLACVLYEMLAGDPPFIASSQRAVLAKHMTDPAPPITTVRSSVPLPIAATLTKALGKAPADRFDSAKAFSEALSAEAKEAEPELKSIVVLPFENLSPEPDNDYFADGLTEELITDLSQIGELRVVSRTSAMMLKGACKSIQSIAQEVAVQYALEGTVRKAGNSLRVTAQLIDARADAHIWAGKFSGTLEDVFDIQEKVSREIVDALKVELSPDEAERIAARPVDNVAAYDSYIRAVAEVHRFQERFEELKDNARTDQVDVKTATRLLLEMIRVLGFNPEIVEESADRVVIKPGPCPIYDAGRSLCLDDAAIKRLCRTRGLRFMNAAAKQLNSRLEYRLVQFRSGPDDSCIEELVMS
jgi:serine/threonine-protein kinase